MQISVNFKNMEPSDNLKSHVEKRLNKLDKLFHKPADARVVFLVEKTNHIAEVNLISSKLKIQAKESSEDMYSSIDLVVDKLKSQLNKFRDKNQIHRSRRNRAKEDLTIEENPE